MGNFLKKIGHYFEQYGWVSYSYSSMSAGMADEWPLLLAYQESLKPRKLFFAPLKEKEIFPREEIRIHAEVDAHFPESCHFLCNCKVLPGYSAYFGTLGDAQAEECLVAEFIFHLGGVDEVIIHDSALTVTRDPAIDEEWQMMAREIGQVIRNFLQSRLPVISPLFFQRVPPEDLIRERVERLIESEINPLLGKHKGGIYLERIRNNTIWLNMSGSCQGCASAPLAFRHEIGRRLRRGVPFLGAIYDVTDHAAGLNPYFLVSSTWQEESYEAA